MKHLFVLTALVSGLAFGDMVPVLQNRSFVNLSVLSKTVTINYPLFGGHGKTCGIEIRTNQEYFSHGRASHLAGVLEVKEGFGSDFHVLPAQVEGSAIGYTFKAPGDYMTLLTISSRGEHGLQETLQLAAGESPIPEDLQAVVTRIDCK